MDRGTKTEALLAVYRATLRMSVWSVPALAQQLGLGVDEVAAAVRTLSELHLLRGSLESPSRLVPVSPHIARRQLGAEPDPRLASVRARAAALDSLRGRLTREYQAAQSTWSDEPTVKIIDDLDTLRSLLEDVTDLAQRRLLLMNPGGGRSGAAPARGFPLDLQGLRNGLTIRSLFQHAARGHRPTAAFIREIERAGGEVRTAGVLPIRMLVLDEDVCVFSDEPAEPAGSVLVVRDRSVTRLATLLFEECWRRAVAVNVELADSRTHPSGLEPALLRLLAEGRKDDSVARMLGLSTRSVRRMVAGLMAKLGSSTRFQAGVRASERGWIS